METYFLSHSGVTGGTGRPMFYTLRKREGTAQAPVGGGKQKPGEGPGPARVAWSQQQEGRASCPGSRAGRPARRPEVPSGHRHSPSSPGWGPQGTQAQPLSRGQEGQATGSCTGCSCGSREEVGAAVTARVHYVLPRLRTMDTCPGRTDWKQQFQTGSTSLGTGTAHRQDVEPGTTVNHRGPWSTWG